MKTQMQAKAPSFQFSSALIAAALIAIFAAQAFWHAATKSATFDEPAHLTISHLLHSSDHSDYDISHPPLARYLFGLPLSFMSLSLPSEWPAPTVDRSIPLSQRPDSQLYYYSANFLYRNRVPADKMLLAARSMNIVLGCLLGLWIFLWSRKLYGDMAGIFSLLFLTFCPNLIAHASLVTTDMGGIAFAVGFLYSLHLLLEKDRPGRRIFAGVLLGAALLTKYTNVFLVPLFLAVLSVEIVSKRWSWKAGARIFGGVAISSWLTVCFGYGFQDVFFSHTLAASDWEHLKLGPAVQSIYRWTPLPDSYLRGFMAVLHHSNRGHSAFLAGDYSVNGWPHYFAVALMVKVPTAAWIVVFILAGLAIARRVNARREELLFALPLAFLVWTALSSQLNIGVRHVMLALPIFYVGFGKIWTAIPVSARVGKALAAGLALLLIVEVGSATPHYLAFFNRPSGGPKNGIRWLSDSNIDWGQDLKGLAEFWQREGKPELVLSYFGTAVPQYYGITYQPLPTVWSYPGSNHINSVAPAKELLAISVTNLQGTYFQIHDLFGWLREREPIARIGYSIYVYNITRDRPAHEMLLKIYEMNGRAELAHRQRERLKRL